ncbi:hypothetical protein SRHO_G00034750 [Serrasalmus rhombeus]
MGVSYAAPATQRRSCWREKCVRGAAAARAQTPALFLLYNFLSARLAAERARAEGLCCLRELPGVASRCVSCVLSGVIRPPRAGRLLLSLSLLPRAPCVRPQRELSDHMSRP